MPKSQKTTKKTVKKVAPPSATPETPKTPKKGGGKSQYETKILPNLAEIERYHRVGVTEAQLCAYYEVGKTQWTQYKKDHPELAEILCNAKKALKTELINRAYEVATSGTYVETTIVEYYTIKDGQKVVTGGKTTTHKRYSKPDAGMLQFLLINRFPDEFARDPHAVELRKKALELAEQGKAPSDGWEGV